MKNPVHCKFNDILKLDCCGSTGTYGFWKLVNSAGYGPISGTQPAVCCDTHPYDGSNYFYSYSHFCEKMVKFAFKHV